MNQELQLEAIDYLKVKFSVPFDLNINNQLQKEADMSLLTELKNVDLMSFKEDCRFIEQKSDEKKFEFKVNDQQDETDVVDMEDKTIMQAKYDTIEKGYN